VVEALEAFVALMPLVGAVELMAAMKPAVATVPAISGQCRGRHRCHR
jgi:hypothetical protein